MGLDECLMSAKARLVMVAFVDLKDEDTADIMRILQDISHENKRLNLAQRFGITLLPTFLYFRSCQQLGSRVTTKEVKLKKDVAKYSRIYLSSPQP
ncbi:unnamed protein product [Dibothriocephalus latus]|uniref:Thioredoxin domain-containing protein n=1 Tax=Dibothriocephalus latus TaxID=60516 RepID=A0A3P6U0C0_DIBLA|nr:unnamed protein product [Dibothriocephalus latus]